MQERKSKQKKSVNFRGTRFVGLVGAAKGWTLASIARSGPRVLLVTKDRNGIDAFLEDLKLFQPGNTPLVFPAWDTLPFEQVSPSTDVSAQRIRALLSFANTSSLVLTSIDALLQKVLPREYLRSLSRIISLNERIEREDLLRFLDAGGYKNVSLVEEIGDMAIRGGVIDIFPATTSLPVRLEFLDDQVRDIRLFDPESQRSFEILSSIEVLPVREILDVEWITKNRISLGEEKHLPSLSEQIESLKIRGKEIETPPREIAKFMSYLRSGIRYPGMEVIQPVAFDVLVSPFSYLPEDTLVVLDDELSLGRSLDTFSDLVHSREQRLRSEHCFIPRQESLYGRRDEILPELKRFSPTLLDHLEVLEGESSSQTFRVRCRLNTELQVRLKSQVGTGEALRPLQNALKTWRRDDFQVVFVVGSRSRAERLQRLLLEIDIDAPLSHLSFSEWYELPHRSPVVIIEGHLSVGIELTDEGLVLIAENEVFHERSYRKSASRRSNLKKIMSSLAQLREGDFVVHADYGIGKYFGLRHMEVGEKWSDFLQIDYADSRLYLPVQNIGKVQKFTGADGQVPGLDKLGSTRWIKTKQKVRESVVSLAGDLIKLYASRSVAQGWRFEPWGAEDERFGDSFPFNETQDQLKAIQDTIADMSGEKPMDRLVCGDVGFGKTEVAIRAAFKCVQHGRQVALLAPTTILVEQHRRNFMERFADYPVKVGALSRFYPKKANEETIQQLANGELDIVIGTHKLLSKDIRFKDLGLLMIDEEHRFGVKQKEKLKQLRSHIDVLTLTATPIPRTLHMSLVGIRDISVMSTPPVDRRVVRTYIAHYEKGLVRDAILRELQRGGQCFYVHNRVQSIDLVSAEIREIVPEARIVFAHGQMTEHQLEDIMRRFFSKEIDVLIATTIIESGIDFPNANTILIDRADTYGLAQLYQLRGRVGRSTRQAYCYFLIPKARKLGAEAQNRLKALQALDDLGMGFHLALRDMEIRGAGNLLGKEQSGSVLSVGFDLYTKILKEAVLHLKGEEPSLSESIDPEVKLGIDAFIPDYYIPDVVERLILYQRLAQIEISNEADELMEEMEDRFGPASVEVRNLLEVMRLRGLLRTFGVTRGEFTGEKLSLSLSPQARFDTGKILQLTKQQPNRYRFGKGLVLSIVFEGERGVDPTTLYWGIHELLSSLQGDVNG